MSATDTWPPKRPGPASDRDSITRQTLQAGIRAPPPEKPYVTHRGMGAHGGCHGGPEIFNDGLRTFKVIWSGFGSIYRPICCATITRVRVRISIL